MKLKQTLAVLAATGLAVSAFAQGTVLFQNATASAVIDSQTGIAAASGLFTAGLYFTEDLGATPNVGIPNDGWTLASTTPIIKPPIGTGGQYRGGTVELTGADIGQEVLVQVRGWTQQYANYAEAFASGTAYIGATAPLKVKLAGGTTPPSSLGALGITGMTMTPVPEPSTIVLGLLGGLGAMVLLRRRQ